MVLGLPFPIHMVYNLQDAQVMQQRPQAFLPLVIFQAIILAQQVSKLYLFFQLGSRANSASILLTIKNFKLVARKPAE